mmetsp:Transcript_24165/g.46399  ORF Transcript_24165/g.46399 Transcript_24165/m.46399 type:complete len:234 (-) Transcript_24165:61-762(-)
MLLPNQPLVCDAVTPRLKQAHLRPSGAQRRVDQPRQGPVVQQGFHVVHVPHTSKPPTRHGSAIARVIEQSSVGHARLHKLLKLGTRPLVNLVVRPVANYDRHVWGQPHAAGVGVEHHGWARPEPGLPQRRGVQRAFGTTKQHIWLHTVNLSLEQWKELLHRKPLKLRVWDPVVPMNLESSLFHRTALPGVHLLPETRTDDKDPLACPMAYEHCCFTTVFHGSRSKVGGKVLQT